MRYYCVDHFGANVATSLANSKDRFSLFQREFCFAVFASMVKLFTFIAEFNYFGPLCRVNLCCLQCRINFLDILWVFCLSQCHNRQRD